MKRLLTLACILALLVGCAPAGTEEDTFTITTTTYPVYLLTMALTENIPDVKVERLDTGSVSCLHDYTLSVNDMKKIERADALALSGAGLEDFMSDVLSTTDALVIDCSQDIALLPAPGEFDPQHSHFDPHYWLDATLSRSMVDNLYSALSRALPQQDGTLFANCQNIHDQLQVAFETTWFSIDFATTQGTAFPGMITFHDGFRYLAESCRMPILHAIEEEAGSEASAKDMDHIIQLIREHNVPVIFTEVNGSEDTANAIARETGCSVVALSMLMDGPDPAKDGSSAIDLYVDGLLSNVFAIIDGFSEPKGGDPA